MSNHIGKWVFYDYHMCYIFPEIAKYTNSQNKYICHTGGYVKVFNK